MAASVPAEAKKKPKRSHLLKPIQLRRIDIETQNVFNPQVPGENFWLFRFANFLHVTTHPFVIRRELLVHPGDWTDLDTIEESERNLRALPFIKEATISKKQNSDGSMDLLVKTQDAWTTQPQFNISSEGNQTSYSAGFEEINLLGLGKDVSYFYKSDQYGITHQLGYNDPQFLNTRATLNSSFEDTPTGNAQNVDLERPFYSFRTRFAGGLPMNHLEGVQRVFQGGQQISQYDQEHLNLSPFLGLRLNDDPLNVFRMQVSYRYTEDVFHDQGSLLTQPGTLPANKALSGPILSASFVQSDFIKETFVEKTGRVEDFNLGHQANVGVGYIAQSFGATENSVSLSGNDSFGFGGTDSWFGLVSLGMTGRYHTYSDVREGGRLFNTLYFANLSYYQHLLESFPMTAVVNAESAYLQNPDVDNLLSLGGNTGLRGYSISTYTGNKSMLFNIENRFFYPQEILHLAYVGGAVFVDAGQVQPQGLGYTAKDFHADVGFGMRFGLTRSAAGTVFRIDLAYAVGPTQQSNRWVLSISSAQGFKSTDNTYVAFSNPTSTQ